MKTKLFKALSAVLLCSLVLTFTACSSKKTTSTQSAGSQSSSSPYTSSASSYTFGNDNAGENSSYEFSSSLSQDTTTSGYTETNSLQPQVSASDEEAEALKRYGESMHREGIIPDVPGISSGAAIWKVNNSKIGDFNNDGSPELIIQYYCGFTKDVFGREIEKQGIAIGIVKYKNGSYQEFMATDNMNKYVRNAGAEITGMTEFSDEPYIDENGNIGILVSRYNVSGAGTTLSYGLFTPDNTGTFNFAVREGSMEGNPVSFCEYSDFLGEDTAVNEISKDEALRRFNTVRSLNKIQDFKVTSDSLPLNVEDRFYALTNS